MDSVHKAIASSSRQAVVIFMSVLVICLLGVSADQTLDTTNSATLPASTADVEQMDSFWEYYFLSHLQSALNRRISKLKDDQRKALENDNTFVDNERQKRKVIGVAGLDNFDVMTKTLDRTRNRFPMMMSVPRMNTNRLRMLMESQGRRK